MNYTNDKEQIVFLKDSDIVSTLDGLTLSGNTVVVNGVPSFDLLSTLHQQLTAYDENLSSYIRDVVGLSAENLSTEISTVVAVKDETGATYNHLSVFMLTNEEYKDLSASDSLEKNAIYIIKDTFVSMRDQQVKDVAEPTLSTDAATKNYVDVNDIELREYADAISLSVDGLSGTLSSLISRDKKDISYLGNVTLQDEYDDPETEGFLTNKLYGLLYTNLGDRTKALYSGFMFKVVASTHPSSYEITDGTTTKTFEDNDYIIVTKDVDAVKNVTMSDITVIKDYDLSVHLIQNQIDSINLSVDGLDADISFLSTELSITTGKLAADIKDIQDDVRGGVNYKGHINLDEKLADGTTPKYHPGMTLSAIFGTYLSTFNIGGEYVDNVSLNNGWLYNITTSAEYVTGDVVPVSLENNDYIIIHSHSLSCVDVSAITRANVDLIEAVQDDYVRFYQHSQLSTALSGEIDTLSSKLSSEVDSLSTSLSATIDNDFLLSAEAVDIIRGTLTEEIRILSVQLSGDIDTLSANLSSELSCLSAGISADVNTLSGALSAEISVLSSSLSSDIDTLSGNLSTEISALRESLSSTVNSDYVHISGDSNVGTLQLSGDLSVVNGATFGSDDTNTVLKVQNNGIVKYTIDNRTDHAEEFEIALQAKAGVVALTSDISALSTSLSTTVDRNVEALSNSISATVNDEFVSLTGDVGIGTLGLTAQLSVADDITVGRNNSSYKFNIDSSTGKLQYTVNNNDPTSTTYEIGLQSKNGVVALSSDITSLSSTIDEAFLLSAEAVDIIRDTLVTEINTLSDNIIDNKNAILSNDNDINYLSAQLSTVADDHYYKTLSAVYHDGPDNLLVTDHNDEPNHQDYVMIFKYGTLVLSSIN